MRAALALGIACAAAASPALAHDRLPRSTLIVAGAPDRFLLRTTFGLLESRDGGASLHYVCPRYAGFAEIDDPPLAIAPGGAWIVGTSTGVFFSPDGCTFAQRLPGTRVLDVKAGASAVYAISAVGLGGDTFDVALQTSSDGGDTWTRVAADLPPDFLALSIGTSTGSLWLAGRDGRDGAYRGALFRSNDGGVRWRRFDVPDTDGVTLPYVAAARADRVYLGVVRSDRVEQPRGRIVVFEAGGARSRTAFEREQALPAVALSPGGDQLAVGGPEAGVWIASTDRLAFAQTSTLSIRCAAWSGAGLHVCTDLFSGAGLTAISTDGGRTFARRAELASIRGPDASCGAARGVVPECSAAWRIEEIELARYPFVTPSPDPEEPATTETCGCTSTHPHRIDVIGLALLVMIGGAIIARHALPPRVRPPARRAARRLR